MPEHEDLPTETQPDLFPGQDEPERSVPSAADGPSSAGPADGVERSLDPASITLDRVGRGIFAAVFAGGSFVALSILLFTTSPGFLGGATFLAGWAVLAAFLGVMAWFWPPVRYRRISYRLDEKGIRIKRGVIWRSVVSVPQTRVQHTDVSQGPLERALGLATLIIHTAGTQNASVSLSGLRREDAQRIRDYLVDVDERDAV